MVHVDRCKKLKRFIMFARCNRPEDTPKYVAKGLREEILATTATSTGFWGSTRISDNFEENVMMMDVCG